MWGESPEKRKESDGMTLLSIFGSTKVLKRNPWMKIERGLVAPGKEYILADPVAWTGNKAARPAGVKAINDIFAYVGHQLADITSKARVHVMARVMSNVDTYATKSAIDDAITAAKTSVGAVISLAPKKTRAERAAAKTEAHTRIPTYEALAKALGAK